MQVAHRLRGGEPTLRRPSAARPGLVPNALLPGGEGERADRPTLSSALRP